MKIWVRRRGLALAAGVGMVVVVTIVTRPDAEAKGPTWVMTGGELGAFAVNVNEYVLEIEGFEGLPGAEATEVDAPSTRPTVYYDLYPSSGVFHVAVQQHDGGADLRYYPEGGLLQERRPYDDASASHRGLATDEGRWYALSENGVEFMDAALEYALGQVRSGEAESNPAASDWRARGMASSQYLLRHYPSPVVTRAQVNELYRWIWPESGVMRIEGGGAEAFIMTGLLETMSQRPVVGDGGDPVIAITTEGEGWGGPLGAYTPPGDGKPGRFWPGGYAPERPYYETASEFDAQIALVLETRESRTGNAIAGQSRMILGALIAVLAMAITAGSLFVWRRRSAATLGG